MLIKDIKNEQVRELAIKNAIGIMWVDRDKVLETELGGAFSWKDTPEGDHFWCILNNDQDSQEAEALIQDVLKPTAAAEDKYTGNRVPLDPEAVVGLGSTPPEDKLVIVGEVTDKPPHVDTTGVLNSNFIKSPFDYLQMRKSSGPELDYIEDDAKLQERLDRSLKFESTNEKLTVPASGSGKLGATTPKHKLEVIGGKIKVVNPGTTSQDDLIQLSKELQEVKNHRSYNVGKSDYAEHNIQPWDIWKEYKLDPWDADIVKRVLRKKEGESRIMDYEKIKHICDEKIAQEKEKEQLNK